MSFIKSIPKLIVAMVTVLSFILFGFEGLFFWVDFFIILNLFCTLVTIIIKY